MRKVKMENGDIKYTNSIKHEIGTFYENWARNTWHIITSVEAGEVYGEYGIEKTWLHTMREATPTELAEKEKAQAEWDTKSSDEHIKETVDTLAGAFPGLDW